jgi:hypothetical protein
VCSQVRRAGLTEISAWVREMDDESAFMQLVVSNTQSELSPLERGVHALEATEPHGLVAVRVTAYTKVSPNAYSKAMSVDHKTVVAWIAAAKVVKRVGVMPKLLAASCLNHLAQIFAAPRLLLASANRAATEGRLERPADRRRREGREGRERRAATRRCSRSKSSIRWRQKARASRT